MGWLMGSFAAPGGPSPAAPPVTQGAQQGALPMASAGQAPMQGLPPGAPLQAALARHER